MSRRRYRHRPDLDSPFRWVGAVISMMSRAAVGVFRLLFWLFTGLSTLIGAGVGVLIDAHSARLEWAAVISTSQATMSAAPARCSPR